MREFISKFANKDHGTTALGAIGAAALAANIDYSKLLQGDHTELSKAIGAGVLGLFGYLTNKGQSASSAPTVK